MPVQIDWEDLKLGFMVDIVCTCAWSLSAMMSIDVDFSSFSRTRVRTLRFYFSCLQPHN